MTASKPRFRRGAIYYVYVIFRPNGTPCYVGKGKGSRWQDRHSHNHHLAAIFRLANGNLPIAMVREGLPQLQALELECSLIKAIGRRDLGTGPLVNQTDGGDGMTNPSITHRAKLAAANLANYDKIFSTKTRAKLRAKRGSYMTIEHRANISAGLTGRIFPTEHREKIAAAVKQAYKTNPWNPKRGPDGRFIRSRHPVPRAGVEPT